MTRHLPHPLAHAPVAGEAAGFTDQALARALAGKRVLIAYGLIGERLAAMRRIGVDYMATQAAWLRHEIGAEVAVIRLATSAAIADNAERIAAALRRDGRPAVVVAHSKGGLETLAALMDHRAAQRCAAVIAIQSPFFGSPVADVLVAAAPLRATVAGSLRLLGTGSGAGLRDLTTAARLAWMERHAAEIDHLLGSIPIVCCATELSEATVGPDRRYLALARWIERQGFGPNDGMVSVRSALLPGARHLVLGGGHRGTVSKGRGRDPVGLLRRLLKLALIEAGSAVTHG
jgi:hypothetical protein